MREPCDEQVTVTLAADQAAAVRRVVDAGGAESVAAFVTEAVHGRLARDRALAVLHDLYTRRGVTLRPEHHAWARCVLGVGHEAAGPPSVGGRPASAPGPAAT